MANGLILNVDTTKSEFQNPMVELRQGDGNYQSLHVTVTNNGDPVDLTGWTITFMGTTAGAHKIVDANAVVDNALQGTFNYKPTKAWGQDIGEFNKAYFKFVKSDETASGANFRVNVLEAVDLTDEEAGDYISVVDALIDKVKTDMDAKLADTQKTLSDTQTQANTVQTNVDDLNTNVNELKAQNNNLLTSDNTWSGSNKFTKIISGSIDGNSATSDNANHAESATTANDPNAVHNTGNETVAGDKTFTGANTFSGINNFNAEQNFNGGVIGLGYSSLLNTGNGLSVVPDGARQTTDGGQSWHSLANDDSVVHLTGTETITGDKAFSGTNSFSGSNTFTGTTDLQNQKQYKSSFTIGSNIINLTRIGSIIFVNAYVNSQISGGSSYGTIPSGFLPISSSIVSYIRGTDQATCLFQTSKSVWFPSNANVGANMSGSYITADAFPTS